MLKDLLRWVLNLSRLGVFSDEKHGDDEVSRRIIFSNVIFISLPIVYPIFMAIDLKSYLVPIHSLRFDQFVVPIIIAVCFFCLWLNHKSFNTFSRLIFTVLWPLLLHIIPIVLLQTPSDYYLAYPFGLVFHSMLIQLMFSYKKESILFWFLISINAIGLISCPAILMYFDTDSDHLTGMVNYKYYFYDTVLYWLLFNLVTFYILYVIEKYIKAIHDSKQVIENQKEELNSVNENLEVQVAQRTSELEERNDKLRQHAYYNAHLLRGPFCRIQGLVQLEEILGENSKDSNKIKEKLKESLDELDSRIMEIQKLVETDSQRHQ